MAKHKVDCNAGVKAFIGPNHKDGCTGTNYVYSGSGYNRVRVCSCGAEDHDPAIPDCKNTYCKNLNYYGNRYDGYCLECSNAGVDEFVERLEEAEALLHRARAKIEAGRLPPDIIQELLDIDLYFAKTKGA